LRRPRGGRDSTLRARSSLQQISNVGNFGTEKKEHSVVSRSKAENAEAVAQAGIAVRGYTRKQFAVRWGISDNHYRKLRQQGLGPDEINISGVNIIPIESENRWAAERLAEAHRLTEAQKKSA
jgi:hypothetical protein